MSPEERQLLAGLFERTRSVAAAPRDQEAESFIAEQLRTQPGAPYLLAQTVLVQDQALQAANQRLQQLESRVNELESQPHPEPAAPSFLGGLFGGQRQAPPSPRPAQPYGQPGYPQGGAQSGYPQGGPWGAAPTGGPAYGQPPGYPPQQQGYAPPQQAAAGGGFLKGALGAAAGVAGGVLLADSIRGLFHGGAGAGGNLGIGQGLEHAGGGDTVINNYYGDQSGGQPYPDAGYDGPEPGGSDVQNADYDDGGSDDGGDGGFDV
jgi:hypothetical protein